MYSVGQSITPDQAMRFALETAKQGRGFTSPNPLVGCVIVDKDHNFLGAGAHLKFGEAHAEINAFASVEDKSKLVDGTLYVTLEPCSHQGKTPPCSLAISKSPIKKVVYATVDPNPLVAGKGIEQLRINGKEVEHFSQYEKPAKEIAEQFFYHVQSGLPFVALKVGTSLDGKIALNSGESQWITGEEARSHARTLRAHYDATMIGAGTLEYDNPTLDFRETSFAGKKQNKIIILDPKGKGAEKFKESNLYKAHGSKNVYVLTRSDHVASWSKNLVHAVQWDASPNGWKQALKNLKQKDIHSIYVEGGSYVFGQILSYSLAQKLYLFQSSKILGNGVSWSKYFENKSLSVVPTLRNWQSIPIGADRLNIGYF